MPSKTFPVLFDAVPEDKGLPPFMVSTSRGFLPRQEPVVELPPEFGTLESILSRMPIKTASGERGLLAEGKLGETVLRELPDLSDEIGQYKRDLPLMNALYRDYSFLASAYLLEPCHERHVRGEEYGLGRQSLPPNIAIPISKVAELSGFKPFMEYAGSYALFNYRAANPDEGLEYSNLRLIRAFEHGLDPSSSEAGFVLVHVEMVKQSGPLVSGAVDILDAAERKDREAFNAGLHSVIHAMSKVNKVMNGMWSRSKPGEYTNFRTFIFGITSQSMFPHGVVYEGVSSEPFSFRGESGANDSMIPLCDNLLQIAMPSTPLTEILKDFRSYRPGNHREFLEWVAGRADEVGVHAYAAADAESAGLYILALDQVRDFRWRHWCFTREYILKHTSHPTATGGSPIVTWLPNQLLAVMDGMISAHAVYEGLKNGSGSVPEKIIQERIEEVMERVTGQRETLAGEVEQLNKEREQNK